jgi:hypothetical protein
VEEFKARPHDEVTLKIIQAERRMAEGTPIDPMLLNVSSMLLVGDETVLIEEPSIVRSPINKNKGISNH